MHRDRCRPRRHQDRSQEAADYHRQADPHRQGPATARAAATVSAITTLIATALPSASPFPSGLPSGQPTSVSSVPAMMPLPHTSAPSSSRTAVHPSGNARVRNRK